MKRRRYNAGFTLIEMLIVVAVIALLATMVVGLAARIDNQSKERALKSTFTLLDSALQEYYEYTGKFPEQAEKNFANAAAHSEYLYRELDSIPSSRQVSEKISNSLIKNKFGAADTPPEIYDLWGTVLEYRYKSGDNFPLLISAGPDRNFGTADDISNK